MIRDSKNKEIVSSAFMKMVRIYCKTRAPLNAQIATPLAPQSGGKCPQSTPTPTPTTQMQKAPIP